MKIKRSLRFKLIVVTVFVIAPLVFFLSYNNFYAMRVVRGQVASSNSDLVSMYVQEKIDKTLEDTGKYLLTRAGSDPDVLALNAYSPDDGDYQLTKIRIINRFRDDQALYNTIDTFFVYTKKDGNLTVIKGNYEDYPAIPEWIIESGSVINSRWYVLDNGDHYGLATVVKVSPDVSIGAWISLDNLLTPFNLLNLGGGGEAIIVNRNGELLTKTSLSEQSLTFVKFHINELNQPYMLIKQPEHNYLMVGTASRNSEIRLVVLVPEKQLLQRLPFFQWVVWLIPIGAAIVLAFYLILMKRVLFFPLGELIRGMRRIIHGDLNFRLEEGKSNEFSFLANTFNHMVEQITQLKINVYEEKLRVQKAEFKHLQVQINPHFYLNSLNIIYNLAALNQIKNVQKMALHLANYFKFTIRTNRSTVTIAEEIGHIQNYLEIQKLRYPDHLIYDIHISAECAEVEIPPLTIQPFVENCIIHGFDKDKPSFHIEIVVESIEKELESYLVTIRDNGRGFSPEYLEKLSIVPDSDNSDDSHIGIWNVQRRLRISFGNEVQIQFANSEDGGAAVTIYLPIRQGGRADV